VSQSSGLETFTTEIGDLNVVSTFSRPLFELLDPGVLWRACGELFDRLQKYGVRMDTMTLQNRPTFGTSTLEIPLFDWAMTIRINVRQIEIGFLRIREEDRGLLMDVAESCELGIRSVFGALKWGGTSVDVRLHGRLATTKTADFIRQYVTGAPDLGPALTKGASFTFLPTSEPGMASAMVVLEPSTSIADGLYLRFLMSWVGAESLSVVRKSAERYYGYAVERLGLII
jgi:hypothetical protein